VPVPEPVRTLLTPRLLDDLHALARAMVDPTENPERTTTPAIAEITQSERANPDVR
jgi:hypothetical protein